MKEWWSENCITTLTTARVTLVLCMSEIVVQQKDLYIGSRVFQTFRATMDFAQCQDEVRKGMAHVRIQE